MAAEEVTKSNDIARAVRSFLRRNPENGDMNQYWYSTKTIETVVAEVDNVGGTAIFLSTPSIYFCLPPVIKERCYVFDIDEKWHRDRGFVRYDFNEPENIPDELRGKADLVVVDPPFITEEVWEKYALTTKALLRPGVDSAGTPQGKILASTIAENKDLLERLLDVRPQRFQPAIPNLVYQYDFFTNYSAEYLAERNPEIPAPDDA